MQRQGFLWRGGLCLLFLFLLPLNEGNSLEPLTAPGATPDHWLGWVLRLEQTAKNLLSSVMGQIKLEDIHKNKDFDSPFDQTLSLRRDKEKFEVLWDSKKTGMLPGPQATQLKATIEGSQTVQHYEAQYEEKIINEKEYYKTALRFAISSRDGKPLRRGYAEIFRDVEKQRTKISTSTIEGASDILPAEMLQINLQAVVGGDGTLLLRQDQGDPIHIPKDQRQFCRNSSGAWVSEGSQEWKEKCAPLFDGSIWHGFSFTMIPMTHESFFKR